MTPAREAVLLDDDIGYRDALRQLRDVGWAHGYQAFYRGAVHDEVIVRARRGSPSTYVRAALVGWNAAENTHVAARQVRVLAALQSLGIRALRTGGLP